MKKGVKILIGVLVAIIIGLVIFIVVDKTISKDSKKENQAANVASNSTAENTANENKTSNENKTNNENTSNENKSTQNTSNKTEQSSVSTASKKIAAALKERRFMAKNGIDTNSKAEFVKVGKDVYLIQVRHNGGAEDSREYVTVFTVTYDGENALFKKMNEEPEAHPYDLFVDADKHILKADRTYKGLSHTILYNLSDGDFKTLVAASKPYDSDYKYSYLFNDCEITKEQYEEKMNEYDRTYNFKDFSSVAVALNDANIDKIVK